MNKENKGYEVSKTLLWLIALAFCVNVGLYCFAVPKFIAWLRPLCIIVPEPTQIMMIYSNFIAKPINDIILAPILLASAVALVQK